ncbi:MAG: ABC transporter substrate-binding protein [Ignavibacteriae bacterium]|nr:ABC transporter substrate-binding protein [Ignavibacteria bacterium]MBI3365798.1 ABC transporter substrate-binding protein [Ignavibacteriota bacterium]
MSKQQVVPPASTHHRREFLKTFGAVVGGLAINQFSLASAEASRLGGLPKLSHVPSIGLLLPSSRLNPRFGDNVAAGLRLCFDQLDAETGSGKAKVFVEEFGTSSSLAVKNARALIAERNVDVLIGVMTPGVAVQLHDVLESSRTFLILADAGANVVRNVEHSPYVFHNSLNYWRSSWAMGEWVVRNIGRKVFVASSFYESGYDALYAFRLGVNSAGGTIVQTHISHVPPNATDLPKLMDSIRDLRPDVVFASYSGQEASEFVGAYVERGLDQQVPLAGSAFMSDDVVLNKVGSSALGVRSCLSWSPSLPTAENISFMKAFEEMTGRTADAFAVLGYDAARLVIEAVKNTGGDLKQSVKMREALRQAKFTSPRGIVRMNAETHEIVAPLYLRQVRQNGAGLINHALDELKPTPVNNRTVAAFRGEVRTGWLNAYAVI